MSGSSFAELSKTTVVVVEDEAHLARGLRFNLEAEGYQAHVFADGESALAYFFSPQTPADATAHQVQPAAIILDVMLPGRDGFSIVRELRERQIYTPVLLLTARSRPEDVLTGFAAGADDYLAKPFDLSILFARLKSLLRRTSWQRDSTTPKEDVESKHGSEVTSFSFAGRTIDFAALRLTSVDKHPEPIRLTLMEAELLRYLVRHQGEIISRKQLLEEVWHVREDTDTRAIDNFMVRLRRYIEDDPSRPVYLETVRGVGYRFVPGL